MRYFVLLMLGALLLGSCNKKIEQVQLNALMDVITSGQWQVTSYVKGTENITSHFAPYSFQFKRDDTVDAIKDGAVEKTGSWVGNPTDLTIQSSFGNIAAPLSLLNGTWKVTKTSTTFVESNQVVAGEQRYLRLDKK